VVGLATLVTVAAAVTHRASGLGVASSVEGYRVAFDVMAGFAVVTAALALLLEGPRRGMAR
jgi:hypothetical protein